MESTGMADLDDPAIREKSKHLFPVRDISPLPDLPGNAPHIAIDADDLVSVVKLSDN